MTLLIERVRLREGSRARAGDLRPGHASRVLLGSASSQTEARKAVCNVPLSVWSGPGIDSRRNVGRGFEREADCADRKVVKDWALTTRRALKPDT